MGVCCKLVLIFLTVALAIIGYQINSILYSVPPIPTLENTWWGHGDPSKEDQTIKPFKINVPDQVLKDLQQRLTNARPFQKSLEGAQQNYGINSKLLTNIIEFWKTKYDWKEREKFLNQYTQFTVSVQGLKIHYLHVKPTNTKGLQVFPLLLLHGWPGSVREFYEILPFLTTPQKGRNFVFEVIAPSLPGYGFSDAAVRPGLGAAEMAVVFKNFMSRLGFEKYYVQGGDWGAIIVQHLSTFFPERILGLHSNMCITNSPLSNLKLFIYSFMPSLIVDKEHEHLVYPLSKVFSTLLLEMGYMHIQATKPDTVGVALNDSPVGLAAYILEKFTTWTNKDWQNLEDGGLTKKFTLTNLLDNVMIYWISGSITTSARLYAESFNKAQLALQTDKLPIKVPTACARFNHELLYQPSMILEDKFPNLLQVSDLEGGHFAAFEVPDTLAKDIYNFVEKVLSWNKEKNK